MIDIDALKALAAEWQKKERDSLDQASEYGNEVSYQIWCSRAATYERCAADVDKVIAQAKPAVVTDDEIQAASHRAYFGRESRDTRAFSRGAKWMRSRAAAPRGDHAELIALIKEAQYEIGRMNYGASPRLDSANELLDKVIAALSEPSR